MSTLVIKFGGTSVMDTKKIHKAAEIVVSEVAKGHRVVTVVSAMGHTTDHLIELARQLQVDPDPREMDSLLVTGEQTAAALLSMAIQAMGQPARSMNGCTAGILTDSNFGSARIETVDTKVLVGCLNDGCVPIIAGFQGKDRCGQWTTLGRGGSDTTAVALAAAICADRCDIYTDVDGIYSADPNLCAHAYKLDAISFKDMLEMARNGAQVLNARSVEIAMKNGVNLRVRSTFSPMDVGTLVTRFAKQLNWFTGIAVSKNKACIKVRMTPPASSDRHAQRAFRHQRFTTKKMLKASLTNAGIDYEVGRSLKNSGQELSISIAECDALRVQETFENLRASLKLSEINVEKELVKVSIISSDLASSHEVNALLSLTRAHVPISIVINQFNRLSLLVPASVSEEAMRQLHANVCLLKMAS